MENMFDLKTIRKAKGIKQEELAEQVGVSPQAVSKWESGGLPDAALLPSIADALGVTINELFGRRGEQSIQDHFLQYFHSLPQEERMEKAYNFCRLISAAFCGMDTYHELSLAGGGPNAHSLIIRDEGYIQTGIDPCRPYVFLIPQPKDGYESAIPYDEQFPQLFEHLAAPGILQAMYFILSQRKDTFFDADSLGAALKIPAGDAERIMERLLKARFLIQADYLSEGKSKKIYQGNFHGPDGEGILPAAFLSLLYAARTLLCPPSGYSYHSARREQPYFAGQKETLADGK